MLKGIRALLGAAACCVAMAGAAASDAQIRQYQLTIPQAQAAARAALAQEDYALAIQIAKGVLRANPEDAQAYYIISHAYQRLGDARLARKAAGYAFRYSKHPRDRYTTAQMAARAAVQEKRYTLSQYWLRRSFDYAPDDRLRQQAASDFQRLRAENPLFLRLQFSVDPSTNVNSGAKDAENDIDGLDTPPLSLTQSALALSGVVVNAKVQGSYRLARSKGAETRLNFSSSIRQVILSRASKDELLASPYASDRALTGSDFSSIYGRIGLSRNVRLGVTPDTPKGNGFGRAELAYGESWYAGERYFRFYELQLQRGFQLSPSRSLGFTAVLNRRDYPNLQHNSSTAELRTVFSQKFANQSRMSAGLTLAQTQSHYGNLQNRHATGYLTYQPGQKLGPARVTFVLGASVTDYPEYRLLTGPFTLSTLNREDKTVFGNVSFFFDEVGFAGFAPVVTLQSRETMSNIGRFDTGEMTLSIGIRSNF